MPEPEDDGTEAWSSESDLAAAPRPARKKARPGLVVGLVALAGCGALLFAAVTALMVVGFKMQAGAIPGTAVESGSKLSKASKRWLLENEVVEDGEEILWFYSTGLLHVREDGNLITDRRIISYFTDEDGELYCDSATYDRVVELEVEYSDSFFEDTSLWGYTVEDMEGIVDGVDFEPTPSLTLYLSTERGRDRTFVDEAVERCKGAEASVFQGLVVVE